MIRNRLSLPLAALLAAAALPALAAGLPSRALVSKARQEEGKRVDAALDTVLQKRESMGLDQRHGFALKNAHTDELGQTHARFQQTFNGVKVWGGMVIAHTDVDGAELEATSAVQPGIDIGVAPSFGESDALNLAHRELQPKGGYAYAPTAELVIYPDTVEVSRQPGKPAEQLNAVDIEQRVVRHLLAWHVHAEVDNATDGASSTDFLIDARGGAIVKRWNSLQTTAATGTGASQYSGTVTLQTNDLGNGTFELRDTTRGSNGGNYTADRQQALGAGVIYTDADNQWGDGLNFVKANPTTSANGQTAAVDAHYGLAKTWDYYRAVHNRNGIDGIGTQTFNRVHSADPNTPTNINYDNAFWSDSCFCMTYGDGSSTVDPVGGFSTLTAVDVAGHEMSHGVTSRTSALIYANESGGLNESNSDIHGTMVEFYLRGGSGGTIGDTGGNYTIGEQLNPLPLRYMYKPSKDGSSADAWFQGVGNLDVHFSSGPMNRAFYFLARGAQATVGDFSTPFLPQGMTGVGNDKAAHIWYRAMTAYLTPASTYVTARTASIRAAADLYGPKSVEVDAVRNAFAGINVGYTASTFDDVIPPTIRLLVDAQATLITFTGDAGDNLGVANVEFYVDGALLANVVHAPFVFTLNPLKLASGSHTASAIAYDVAGNSTPSRPVNFASVGPAQVMVNPGFETGPGTTPGCLDSANNVDTCTPGWKTTLDVLNYNVTGTHSGIGFAWLIGYGSAHTDTIDQAVSLPPTLDHATLSFYGYFSGSETVANGDTASLQLRDGQGVVIATLATWAFPADYSPGFVLRQFDLTPYKGQSFHVFLTATENGARASNVQVDDFALNVSTTADVATPTVTASLGAAGTVNKMFADVLDDGVITKVEFFVDGSTTAAATVTNGSFVAPLPTSVLSVAGGHSFVAVATDAAGHVGTSAPFVFTVDATTNNLVNPGFETASSPAWTLQASITGTGCNQISTGLTPRTGSRNALLAGCGAPSTATLFQTVTIPATATYASLGFWLRLFNGWTDGGKHDSLVVQIRDTSNNVLQTLATYTNKDDTGGVYVQRLFPNLVQYKGQTIRLALVSTQDPGTSGTQFSRFRLDDFTLNTSPFPDTTLPTVTANISGMYANLVMTAAIVDNRPGTRADFLIDGNQVATAGCCTANGTVIGTYSAIFDSTTVSNGLHTYQVRATDLAGNIGLSAPITFLVANTFDAIPPSVTVAAQSTFEKVTLSASATDNVGVVGVDFLVDGHVVGGSTSGPWLLVTDWASLGGTSHTVTAKAYDAVGNTGTSAPITITRPSVAVTISPSAIGVLPGATVSLTANVTGASNGAVTWSVTSANGGTITAQGVYTAPQQKGDYLVVATSVADPTVSSSALIRVYTGDVNGDVAVDNFDMGVYARAFGSAIGDANYNPDVDLDANGVVNDADLNLFFAQFGR